MPGFRAWLAGGSAASRPAAAGFGGIFAGAEEEEQAVGGKPRNLEAVWADVDALVGLAPVKRFLREVAAQVLVDRERRRQGLPVRGGTMHMVFYGNPGTGKTTAARLVGEMLAALGALPKGHMVEVDRSSLVAGYVGQTALRVKEAVERADGGVLFIDEAYSLARGGPQDFGSEALDTLVKAMEDRRERLVVILAGYRKEMEALFQTNPGLRSRVAFECDFPDYSPSEMLEIARMEAERRGVKLSPEALNKLSEHFERVDAGQVGNGRYARKVVEEALRRQALRFAKSGGEGVNLTMLEAEDLAVS